MLVAALAIWATTAASAANPESDHRNRDANPHQRELFVQLAPRMVGGRVDAILVTETFDVGPLAAGATLLSLPIVAESVPGVLRDPPTLVARDAAGPLPLDTMDDPVDPTGEEQDRHWRVRRTTSNAITVSYIARPRVVTPDTKPAALIDMRTEGAGIYGSTKVLIATPETDWPRTVRIGWDLSAMAPGARAVTSFGEGDASAVLDRKTLGEGYFMAGPWWKSPPDADKGFMVYYLTRPDFDLTGAANDVAVTYRYASRFFGTPEEPFRVLMRTTDRFQGGGTGGHSSFMFGTVKGVPRAPDDLRNLFTHEMLHNWIGSLSGGPDGLWFVEGATNYYEAIMPYRAGQRTLAQVSSLIGEWTRNYYANPRRTMSDAAATAAFWSDDDAQLLPYSRGALYIALVDARLRARSGGQQRVDTLVRAMTRAERRGYATEALWLSLVTKALGDKGRRDFEDLKAGRMLDLPADLFGPCFRRVAGPVRKFMPGVSLKVSADGRHVAGPVRAGSPAAIAGLIQGDEIINWQALDEQRFDATVILQVVRAGLNKAIAIHPWGPAFEVYTWVEKTQSLRQRCSL